MFEGVQPEQIVRKAIAKPTKNEDAARAAAGKASDVDRARKNLEALERRIAQRKIAFRDKMERKGVIPSTPEGMAALAASCGVVQVVRRRGAA